jgi:GNAT superfamily N-acetyltransferase
MEAITVRKATEADLDILHEFEQGVINAERPFDVTLRPGLIHYYDLKVLIHSPQAHLVVAESGNRVIASGYARIDESKAYLRHTHHAYLGFMYVVPEFRGQGVNKIIMGALKQWSKEQNVHELRLQVYENNAPAIRAYEKTGFAKHMVEMRFNLG